MKTTYYLGFGPLSVGFPKPAAIALIDDKGCEMTRIPCDVSSAHIIVTRRPGETVVEICREDEQMTKWVGVNGLSEDERVERIHKEWTAPGSFYDMNGGRFRNQDVMPPEQEREYIKRLTT